ncbi:TRAP transporter large permease subunit [Spirochaetes bacterium]|uniref:TRAP transporter large permease subunit n=1 Tax=Candidatus Scatousia excrementipullorum TaxID=2840936 RepID=A0A9D9DPH2_9BACT|nr:TRAP transporter large permease subunit [Candidatus Scatousia excrementipullorum]
MTIIFNPVIVSVILLCVLCLCRINVLLAIIISAIAAGLVGGLHITEVMNTFISGMGGNSETALSYILLGTFAAAMTHTGLATILAKKIAGIIGNKKIMLLFILAGIAVLSQNLIPVHIAFIPIIIPPLLHVMNKLELDRRAVACSLAFGLKAPYITIPAGFGLIFQGLIAENMTVNGMTVLKNDVWKSTWILGLAMIVGLLAAIFIAYRKPRKYEDKEVLQNELEKEDENALKLNKNHYITLIGAFATLIVQLLTKSLPLGALVGLGIVFGGGAVSHRKMDNLINEGIGLMGYVAFVMLVAAGFAMVLKATGGVDTLVNAMIPFMQNSKLLAAVLMLFLGLFITMGIGTSFGTIPILAVLFIPICIKLGFSVSASVVVLAAAAALGDAGSPASDTTLGPTAGLNADGQHNHITDTCIPTFLFFNIPLMIFALAAVILF